MANEDLNDHELAEQVRKWLGENGSSILTGIALGIAGLWGWNYWQGHQEHQNTQAAVQYLTLGESASGGRADQAMAQFQVLKTDFPKSGYATLGALVAASAVINENKWDAAIEPLEWAGTRGRPESLAQVARLRHARVLAQMGRYADALNLLKSLDNTELSGAAAEARGDILMAEGRSSDAAVAYQKALDDLRADEGSRPDLELKLARSRVSGPEQAG